MLPRPEYDGRPVPDELHAFALLAATDHCKAVGPLDCSQQLVVLAEGEILDLRTRRERHRVELENHSAARTGGNVACVSRDPVRDVEHRVRVRGEAAAFL